MEFEAAFYSELIQMGAPKEAAGLLWKCARAKEPWAIQALLQRLAPQTQQISLTEKQNEKEIDYSRFSKKELDHLETLLERARVEQGKGGKG